jgi:hypothetical protein
MSDPNSNVINSDIAASYYNLIYSYVEGFSFKNYIVLICIAMTSLANGFQLYIIPNEFREDLKSNYILSETQLNLFSYIYPFSYLIATFFAYSLIENLHEFKFVN